MASPSAIKRRVHSQAAKPAKPIPYSVTCECGEVRQGDRTFQFQVLPCAVCGKKVLVFPASRFIEGMSYNSAEVTLLTELASSNWNWRKPLFIAGGIAFLVTALIAAMLIWGLTSRKDSTSREAPQGVDLAPQSFRNGEKAVRDGDFQEAMFQLGAGIDELRRVPDALSPDNARRLRRLFNEVGIVQNLAFESIPEMLHPLPGSTDRIWEQQFRTRYGGKSVMFDAMMHRTAAGAYILDYDISSPDGPVIIQWSQLTLLSKLPLDDPQRMIFGVRLASAKRIVGGRWQIEFDPDSLVLITDADVFRGTSLPPDVEMRDVLNRQSKWLEDLNQ